VFIGNETNGHFVNPTITSEVTMTDGSKLTIAEVPSSSSELGTALFQQRLRFASKLNVAGAATIASYDSTVMFAGQIIAGATNAVLNLEGNDTFQLSGSLVIPEGKSLAIYRDGAIASTELSGASAALLGGGIFNGDISLGDGARVAPGASPGSLSIVGDVVISGGSIYEWEIADAAAGAGQGWDVLNVSNALRFTATQANPWTLKIVDAHGLLGATDQPLLIARAATLGGFDPTAVKVLVTDANSHLSPQQFHVSAEGGSLFVQFVPEPDPCLLTAIAMGILTMRGRPAIGMLTMKDAQNIDRCYHRFRSFCCPGRMRSIDRCYSARTIEWKIDFRSSADVNAAPHLFSQGSCRTCFTRLFLMRLAARACCGPRSCPRCRKSRRRERCG
jgi:hypothetical protein